jgi:TatD DNase family protein
MIEFVDTHCHIHASDYSLDTTEVIAAGAVIGVTKAICVGTDEHDSAEAVSFVQDKQGLWASVGLHPHDAKLGQEAFDALEKLVKQPKVVAIGECGLDYFYNHSDKLDQEKALRFQVELALSNNLPMIFHIRDAFEDFWPIFDSYAGITGVVHSFTAAQKELEEALNRGLYIGLNGIMTFTKDTEQLAAAKAIPLDKLVLETDTPFLTPVPLRGKVNEIKNVVLTADFLSKLRGESLENLGSATTRNAINLFELT